jgi:phosphate-selective porin
VKPISNVGALELVTRYSELGLRDNGLGSDSSIVMVGINYHWSKKLKLMVNYLTPDIGGNTLHADDSGDAISARIQLLF